MKIRQQHIATTDHKAALTEINQRNKLADIETRKTRAETKEQSGEELLSELFAVKSTDRDSKINRPKRYRKHYGRKRKTRDYRADIEQKNKQDLADLGVGGNTDRVSLDWLLSEPPAWMEQQRIRSDALIAERQKLDAASELLIILD